MSDRIECDYPIRKAMFGPLTQRPDGTHVFASPVGTGHVAMITLRDLGFFARYSFDNRVLVSGRDLEVATAMVGWNELVDTFRRVTGEKAEFKRQTVDEWFENFTSVDGPVAREGGVGSTTWRKNFSAFWRQWRDDIIKRDMTWVRSLNPKGDTLESWMRETGYKGAINQTPLLKNIEDGRALKVKPELISKL